MLATSHPAAGVRRLRMLRDRDMTNGWTGSADGTLEERVNYLQNWRADVVAIVEPDGGGGALMKEWVTYSAYGVPFGLPAGDANSDGACDSSDDTIVSGWSGSSYDVRGDLDLDGDVDATDETLVAGAHQALGRGVLTGSAVGNRAGYTGYFSLEMQVDWCARRDVLSSVLGSFLAPSRSSYTAAGATSGYLMHPSNAYSWRGVSATAYNSSFGPSPSFVSGVGSHSYSSFMQAADDGGGKPPTPPGGPNDGQLCEGCYWWNHGASVSWTGGGTAAPCGASISTSSDGPMADSGCVMDGGNCVAKGCNEYIKIHMSSSCGGTYISLIPFTIASFTAQQGGVTVRSVRKIGCNKYFEPVSYTLTVMSDGQSQTVTTTYMFSCTSCEAAVPVQ